MIYFETICLKWGLSLVFKNIYLMSKLINILSRMVSKKSLLPLRNNYFSVKSILWFRAPDPQLIEIPVKAYLLAEIYFQNFQKGNRYDLNRLIGCIYLDNKGFDSRYIQKHARMISFTRLKARMQIAKDFGLFRDWVNSKYSYAFYCLELMKRNEGVNNLIELFERMEYDYIAPLRDKPVKDEKCSLFLKLDYLNSCGKMYFENESSATLLRSMFLDPSVVQFPDVKFVGPDEIMLQNGTFVSPTHN